MSVLEQAQAAKRASFRLAGAAAELKDRALAAIAESLENSRQQILEANAKDQEKARKTDLKEALSGNKAAWENFQKFANSYRNMYIGWVNDAKTDTTRKRRISEVVKRSVINKKPGIE